MKKLIILSLYVLAYSVLPSSVCSAQDPYPYYEGMTEPSGGYENEDPDNSDDYIIYLPIEPDPPEKITDLTTLLSSTTSTSWTPFDPTQGVHRGMALSDDGWATVSEY